MSREVSYRVKGADVRLAGVTKTFGSVVAVDHVSLGVEAGEFLTLLGPSGSGKTTTLMIIAGFELPSGGDVFIRGARVTYTPPYRRDIGLVFQSYALFPHMTVFGNIAFPLEMRGVPRGEIRSRVSTVLDLVRLGGLGDRYPRQLSGGQQQRVALARALVFQPGVLLMDEPLGALDKKLRAEMQLEIKHIQEELGITVVYVTHDQEEALTMSDRVAVIDHGRIEQIGLPQEIYDRPVNRFVADFIGESNFLDVQVVERRGDRVLLRTPDGLSVWTRTDAETPVGARALLAVRPECIAVGVGADPRDNDFEGVIEEVIYVGDTTRYRVRVRELRDPLTVKVQSLPGGSLKRDDPIRIGWSADAGRLVLGA